MPRMRSRLPRTSSRRLLSSRMVALSDSVRMAVSGWLSSCTTPADIWPSAAILPACTNSPCAARSCAVRATTVDSSVSCAACSAAWLASFWRTARRRCHSATATAAAPPSRGWRYGCIARRHAQRHQVVEHHQLARARRAGCGPKRAGPRRRARSPAHRGRAPPSASTAAAAGWPRRRGASAAPRRAAAHRGAAAGGTSGCRAWKG